MIAQKSDAPSGVPPIVWRLLTNRRVETLEEAAELIDGSRARWDIELFFLTLEEGCRVEGLQLGRVERIERTLMRFFVMAWRIMPLMRLVRTLPDLDAAVLLDPDEIKAAYILSKKPVPKQPPRLNEVVRLIAGLGGFLGRKCDGEPGVKTISLGLQRMMDFAAGIKYGNELNTE